MEETKKRKNFPPLRIEYMFRQITLAVGFDSILEDAGGSKGKGSRRSPLSRSSHGIPLNTRGKGTSFSLNPRATYSRQCYFAWPARRHLNKKKTEDDTQDDENEIISSEVRHRFEKETRITRGSGAFMGEYFNGS